MLESTLSAALSDHFLPAKLSLPEAERAPEAELTTESSQNRRDLNPLP